MQRAFNQREEDRLNYNKEKDKNWMKLIRDLETKVTFQEK